MSLDFAVLSENGTPEQTISLSVNLHHELITAANELSLDQILRFEDYYEDVEFAPADLQVLATQVAVLREKIGQSDLRAFLEDFGFLISKAASHDKALHAIAD